MQRLIQPAAACRKRVSNAYQLRKRPLIPMPEKALLTVSGGTGFGVDQVIPCANEGAKVSCGALQLELVLGALKPFQEVQQRIGNPAGRAVFQAFNAARLDPLTAPNGIPFEAGEAEDRLPEGRSVIRMNGYAEAFVFHSLLILKRIIGGLPRFTRRRQRMWRKRSPRRVTCQRSAAPLTIGLAPATLGSGASKP